MRKILLSVLAVALLALLAGCGNNTYTVAPPPTGPSGGNNAGFSVASLSGTYTFATTGVNAVGNTYYMFDVVGVFTTDGAGNVTSGYRDLYTDSGTQVQKEAVTGTYSVNQDGRGQVELKGTNGTATYRFVLQSTGAASFFQFSPTADDIGRLFVQSSVAAPTGNFVVRLDGEDTSLNPFGSIGFLNISGTTVSGLLDQNDDGTLSTLLATTGSITAPDSTGRGTMALTTSSGTHNFVYWVSSTGHLQLASTDANFWLHGYADQQTGVSGSTAAFSGGQVYSLSGVNSKGNIAQVGRFTLDGVGNIASGIEDYNNGFVLTSSSAVSGNYTAAATGRWTATTTSGLAASIVGWQVSASQSVLLVSNGTSTIEETGTLRAQTTGLTNASIVGEFAQDINGYSQDAGGNVEAVANYLADGNGNLTGTMDSQTPGYYNTDYAETGTYSMQTNGRNTATAAGVPLIAYSVDANTFYLISSDPSRQYQGKLVKQVP
jgi:hypothetical protein